MCITEPLIQAKEMIARLRAEFGQGMGYATLHRLIHDPSDPLPTRQNPYTRPGKNSWSLRNLRFHWPEVAAWVERRTLGIR